MPRKTYTSEFKAQLVALVRAGRTPESLAHEYEPSAPTIRDWVAAATESPVVDKDARIRDLERKLAIAEEEKEILKKRRPGSPQRARRPGRRVRVHEGAPGRAQHLVDGPRPGPVAERLLRLAQATVVAVRATRSSDEPFARRTSRLAASTARRASTRRCGERASA